jgi:hypothetical protein
MPPKSIKLKTTKKPSRYIKFGKLMLNHFQLNKNILLVKHPSRGPVGKIRSVKISNSFKSLIHDLLDTQTINKALQKTLSHSEMNLFELLIQMAGLADQLQYEAQSVDVDTYIHRFEILRGQLVAGNDSNLLKKELREIIKILNEKSINKISDIDAAELLDILKE